MKLRTLRRRLELECIKNRNNKKAATKELLKQYKQIKTVETQVIEHSLTFQTSHRISFQSSENLFCELWQGFRGKVL